MPVDNKSFAEKFLRLSLEVLIFFLIFFSPLILGGVPIFPLSVLEALSFLLLFVFVFSLLIKDNISLVRINYLPLFIFLALVIFQLLPLGSALLSVLSPATFDLYRNFSSLTENAFSISIYREDTVKLFLELLSYLAVFFVALNYFDTERKQRRLLICIIVSGFVYAFYGIISKLYAPASAFSSFSNRNHFAAYMLMIIPLGIAMASVTISLAVRIILSFMSSVMVVGLFLSLSRAGRICFILSLLIFIVLLQIKRKAGKALPVILILLVFMIVFVMLIGVPFFLQRLETVLTPLEAYSDRLNILQDSLYIVGDFPVFGTGLGTYGEIVQKYKTTDWQVSYVFVHNEPIQLLSETGIIGFLSIFLFIFFYIYSVFIVWLRRRSHYPAYLTLGCLISLFAFMLHSLFDFVFHVPADALLFFIILALAYRVVYYKQEQDLLSVPKSKFSLSLSGKSAVFFIVLLAVLFFELLIFRRYQAEASYQKLDQKEKAGKSIINAAFRFDDPMEEISRAIAYNPLNSRYYIKRGDILSEIAVNHRQLLDGPAEALRSSGSSDVLSAKDDYLKSISLNPAHADSHLRLGWLYSVLLDQPGPAGKEFRKALMLDPKNDHIRNYTADFIEAAE